MDKPDELVNAAVRFRSDCPCPKLNCPRHGHCNVCEAYHFAKGKLPNCMRRKAVLQALSRSARQGQMDTIIVYDATFGNTHEIAREVAEVMAGKGSIRLIKADQLNGADLANVDFLIAGFPTHRHGMPEMARVMLEGMHSGALRGVGVAAFDTHYRKPRWLTGSSSRKLSRKLRQLGGIKVVSPESFFVDGREGPLGAGELEHARRWAASILGQFEAQESER